MMPSEPPPEDIIRWLLEACQHIKDIATNSSFASIQHCIQQEIVEILSKIADRCQGRNNIPTRTIRELLHIATDFNRAGYIYRALIATDCCWVLLNCLPDIGLGIWDGGSDLLKSGIHAAKDLRGTAHVVAENLKIAARHLSEVLHKICDISVQCAVNDEKGWQRAKKLVVPPKLS